MPDQLRQEKVRLGFLPDAGTVDQAVLQQFSVDRTGMERVVHFALDVEMGVVLVFDIGPQLFSLDQPFTDIVPRQGGAEVPLHLPAEVFAHFEQVNAHGVIAGMACVRDIAVVLYGPGQLLMFVFHKR